MEVRVEADPGLQVLTLRVRSVAELAGSTRGRGVAVLIEAFVRQGTVAARLRICAAQRQRSNLVDGR